MVQLDQRYTVDQALADPFFDIDCGLNGQLRCDLADLEAKAAAAAGAAAAQKWLTSYGSVQPNEEEERFETRECIERRLSPSLLQSQCQVVAEGYPCLLSHIPHVQITATVSGHM